MEELLGSCVGEITLAVFLLADGRRRVSKLD